ncbi:MAG: ABC transporter permease subunit [Acidimicrobiia bacterium]
MTAVLAIEVRRALARRLVRVLVLLALLGIVVIAIGAFATSDPDSLDAFSPGDIWTSEFDESDDAAIIGGVSFVFLLMALLGGASFVGAEYKAGTITTLLTWEPRRTRVIGAKLVAAGVVAGAIFLVLEVLLAGALAPAAIVRGTTEGADDEFYRSLAGFLLRGALITGGCAVLGGSIATVGKNTTAALGFVLGYIVIVEQILRGLRPGWNAWYLAENLAIVLTGEQLDDVVRSVPGAALLLAGYLAVFVAATLLVFARRDVT